MTGLEYYVYRLRVWLAQHIVPDGWAIYDRAAVEAQRRADQTEPSRPTH